MPRSIWFGGFQHETNTFSPYQATWNDFKTPGVWPGFLAGPALYDAYREMNIPISGFWESFEDVSELVAISFGSCVPKGPVTAEAYEHLTSAFFDRSDKPDTLFLDLHGAMVTTDSLDPEGDFISRLRAQYGQDFSLIVALDYHANISHRLFEQVDRLFVYQTYPHVDMREQGQKAAAYVQRSRRPAVKQLMRFPFLLNLPSQITLNEEMQAFMMRMNTIAHERHVDIQLVAGFPLADTPDTGPCLIGYGEHALALDEAMRQVYDLFMSQARLFDQKLWPYQTVWQSVLPGHTYIFADTQDNPGAGGTGTGVACARAYLDQKSTVTAVMGVIHAPEVVSALSSARIGAFVACEIGGDLPGDTPLKGVFEVVARSDGRCIGEGDYYKGCAMDLGTMLVLRQGSLDIVLSTGCAQAADVALFTHLELVMDHYAVWVLKSSGHFMAGYGDIGEREIRHVVAPGLHVVQLDTLSYCHHQRPAYASYEIAEKDTCQNQ